MSSPTHLPRCLRDACSLWLDPQHQPPPRAEGAAPPTAAAERAGNAGAADHGEKRDQGRLAEGGGGENRRRRQRRSWRPLVLASPSDTSYAGYGPDDVAIVEPPHRGDRDCGPGDGTAGARSGGPESAPIPAFSGASAAEEGKELDDGALAARDLSEAAETTTPPLLLHDLVALALRVGKSSDKGFRKELQELLCRYVKE